MTRLRYPIVVRPLAQGDGGGYLATVPDLPGCMSDGDTPETAIGNVGDAIEAWIEAAAELGHDVPRPSADLTVLPSSQAA